MGNKNEDEKRGQPRDIVFDTSRLRSKSHLPVEQETKEPQNVNSRGSARGRPSGHLSESKKENGNEDEIKDQPREIVFDTSRLRSQVHLPAKPEIKFNVNDGKVTPIHVVNNVPPSRLPSGTTLLVTPRPQTNKNKENE